MKFTFAYLEAELSALVEMDYRFVTCRDAFADMQRWGQIGSGAKAVINRIDVDFSVVRAARMAELFAHLNLPATFFFRLHANEYNLLSFENFRLLKQIQDAGFEIGYHSEVVDGAAIWDEKAGVCLLRDLKTMEAILGAPVYGAASHGGLTGLNNLDFWKDEKAQTFGLEYEAYQDGVMEAGLYISDSEWTRWKCYHRGALREGDHRSPAEIAKADAPRLIYMLTHPDTYFDRHIYE